MIESPESISLSLPFNRQQEIEADIVGLDYMARAGFDPRSSIKLWKNMVEDREGPNPPEFLSTHPADDRRMNELVRNMVSALIVSNETHEQGQAIDCSHTLP